MSREAATLPDREGADRVVLVTGSSRGLGASIARTLGARGYSIAVIGRPDGTDPMATVEAIRAGGGSAKSFISDVFDTNSCKQLVGTIQETFGRLDGVVLAATPPVLSRPFVETTDQELRTYLDAYVAGPFALLKAALPAISERRLGRVVAIVTSAVSEVPPRKSAYIAAKAGMLGLCRALAVELAPLGVTVNAINPGALASQDPNGAARAKESIAARTYPMRRLATHADVAEAVTFLLSESASYVSGTTMAVTGGLPL